MSEGEARRRPDWRAWFAPRGRRTGMWAFVLNRITGLLLLAYVFVHLAVLSVLFQGPAGYDRLVRWMSSWPFLLFDVALVAVLLVHGLNGVRLVFVGLGAGSHRQREWFWAAMAAAAAVFAYTTYLILAPAWR
ncbi:MAG: succinate dehydrogenase, cytochrome b556 subunit [Firmicutes bacterium]|nr:succinate dehydrogenase, cytochrome b556 subunit [Bacillota bacterium]